MVFGSHSLPWRIFYWAALAFTSATPKAQGLSSPDFFGLEVSLPSPLYSQHSPRKELKRDGGVLAGLLTRGDTCGEGNGLCPLGLCCSLTGHCCNGGVWCCAREKWCYADTCCLRSQIGCGGSSCCVAGASCCDTTLLLTSDRRITFRGSWTDGVSNCNATLGNATKVTSTSGSSVSFSFNGTKVWLNAGESTYTVVFNSQNYSMTPDNVTGPCDIGWSTNEMPYGQYRVDVFPDTSTGEFELTSFSVATLDGQTSNSTVSKASATALPAHSSRAIISLKTSFVYVFLGLLVVWTFCTVL